MLACSTVDPISDALAATMLLIDRIFEFPLRKLKFVVAIEGGVGAGKSSVLEKCRERGYSVLPEPIESWQPLLALPPFTFQNMCLEGIFQGLYDAHTLNQAFLDGILIVERSLESVDLFSEMKLEGPSLDAIKASSASFKKALELRFQQLGIKIVHVVLDVSPKVCVDRAIQRNRSGENPCVDHARALDEKHLKRFPRSENRYFPVASGEAGTTAAATEIIDYARAMTKAAAAAAE